ncbi:uncharacterized protein LOC143602875 isoform X3 [Bidens hawaiensis]|uniref:uncharacterized protein LOC143602875 isoform X3 n=1 Tax=Bidens hawaiensis TaxID=980011 RepID=UPI00404948B0
MDTSNRRPTRDASCAIGDLTMRYGDWRAQLQRERIVNKIYERLQELQKIAERVENEIYTAATSQSEYSRQICLHMLTIETRLQNPIPHTLLSNSRDWQEEVYQKIKTMKYLYQLDLRHPLCATGAVGEFGDWRAHLQQGSRQRVANKITKHLEGCLPFSGHAELQAMAVCFEDKIYVAASKEEYLRKISLKMLTMENRYIPMQSNSSVNPRIQ